MSVINNKRVLEKRAGHPNMVAGIDQVIKALDELRPDERSQYAHLEKLSHAALLERPVSELLPEWIHFLKWQFKIETIGQLLELGWPPIYAKEGIGRKTLWHFTDALTAVNLAWPSWVVDGHKHPARPKS